MTHSDWISLIALAIASGALALEIRRWFEGGPRLNFSVIGDALIMPDGDGEMRIALTVRNRGNAPTMLTHLVLYGYETRWKKFRNDSCFAAVGTDPSIPCELGLNRSWTGIVRYMPELTKLREDGKLYVGVVSAHSDKNFLIKVPPSSKKKIPDKEVG